MCSLIYIGGVGGEPLLELARLVLLSLLFHIPPIYQYSTIDTSRAYKTLFDTMGLPTIYNVHLVAIIATLGGCL